MINFRVEYEPALIRHASVECPECKKWFNARDISERAIHITAHLEWGSFVCPLCSRYFSLSGERLFGAANIIEYDNSHDVYKDCVTKREVREVIWEQGKYE